MSAITLSFWLYMVATIATILIGLVYALRPRIMPYHLKALETEWDEIEPIIKCCSELF